MHKEPTGNRFIAASATCSTKSLSKINTIILNKILQARRSYCNTIYNSTKVNMMWIIDNNSKVIHNLNNISSKSKAYIIEDCCRTPKYLLINKKTEHAQWSNSKSKNENVLNLTKELMISHIRFLIDNIYVTFCKNFYQQIKGIPMGTDCAPLLANLYLHYYEYKFIRNMMKEDIKLAKNFSNSSRYIDDLISINNSFFHIYFHYLS